MASDEAFLRLRDERDSMNESIKRLASENAAYREALTDISEHTIDQRDGEMSANYMRDVAREALQTT